ncbi:MAG: PAS domain-containing protein [Leptolyngbyaceae cyanobacterium MO_188.B28]|nr:PAS domain-containing protein [Leptolyngbyaceae cyanobacterium MO_188.B28]
MMKFDQQIQPTRLRLRKLRWNENQLSPAAKSDLLAEILENLYLTLESLNVATEELTVAIKELRLQTRRLHHQKLAIEFEHDQDLLNFTSDCCLVTDSKFIIQGADRTAANLLNVAQRYLVGKPLTVFVALEEHRLFFTQLNQLDQSRSVQDWELCLQPRGGASLPVSITLSAITDTQEELIGWRWLIRNITDRKCL